MGSHYRHIVYVENDCDYWLQCSVWTDVDPHPPKMLTVDGMRRSTRRPTGARGTMIREHSAFVTESKLNCTEDGSGRTCRGTAQRDARVRRTGRLAIVAGWTW